MEKRTLFTLDTPYRERLSIEAQCFGAPCASTSVAVVGSMRGNEVQQAYICAQVARRLQQLDAKGRLSGDVGIMVVPTVNSFSMNIASRFWPMDNTDVNRMFPGYDAGETTQRIADGLFRSVKDCTYGIQLCSFYLPGEFEPHVRVMDTGAVDLARSWELAETFGFPYAVLKEPAPFDTTTLNYNWQVWGTYAFSLYSCHTEHLDEHSAQFVVECILRFLAGVGALRMEEGELPAGAHETASISESSLVDVRSCRAGFFRRRVPIAASVHEGDKLAEVLSTQDCAVVEQLTSPCDGVVFFHHAASLINSDTIAFKLVPRGEA